MAASLALTLFAQAVLSAPPPPPLPAPENGYFQSGATFLRGCTSNSARCGPYVMAISDYVTVEQAAGIKARKLCIPPDSRAGDLLDVTLQSLRKHPETLHQPAAMLVHNALIQAFPCRAD